MREARLKYVFERQHDRVPVSTVRVCLQNTTDYSPFGVSLDGRTIQSDFYRYGFQGMEGDSEVKGAGNSYTTEYRQLDPRIGRWLSRDPLDYKQPYQSPYCSMNNNPILFNDKDGDIVGVAIVGFFKGLFSKPTDGRSRFENGIQTAKEDAMNSIQVYSSLFRVNKNNSVLGQIGQSASKMTWQAPQQMLGILVGNVSIMLGVDKVEHTEQGTTLIKRTTSNKMQAFLDKYRDGWFFSAFTLGSIVNYQGDANQLPDKMMVDNTMREHEFGHYEQSKRLGPIYLLTVAIPSLISASTKYHHEMPWEKNADKLSHDYFDRNKTEKSNMDWQIKSENGDIWDHRDGSTGQTIPENQG